MKRGERIEDPEYALILALRGLQGTIWTTMPGIVETVDLSKRTCTVQPAIMAQVYTQQDQWSAPFAMPLCLDVPIVFPGGGGFSLTFPLVVGDEVLLFLASRCIDAWWQQSGVQPQAEYRMHSLSDGFAFCGPRSLPNVESAISTSTVQLRSDSGDVYVEIESGNVVNVVAPGGINLTGPVNITGNLHTDGDVSSVGALTNNSVDVGSAHKHSGVTPGGSNTGNPI